MQRQRAAGAEEGPLVRRVDKSSRAENNEDVAGGEGREEIDDADE